jgi:hypothetical protein
MKIQHANPYYDDSYAVNSANLGPYGDAIETELVPAVEKQFRAIGRGLGAVYVWRIDGWLGVAGCADVLSGHYNRAFVACPDPVDFHAYLTGICIRRQHVLPAGANKRVEQPAMRDYLGHTSDSVRD